MEQWSSFRAKWRDDNPGHADVAMTLYGLVFKTRLKPDDLVSRGMVVALCAVSQKTVSAWMTKKTLVPAKKQNGVALFSVRDVYRIAQSRGIA